MKTFKKWLIKKILLAITCLRKLKKLKTFRRKKCLRKKNWLNVKNDGINVINDEKKLIANIKFEKWISKLKRINWKILENWKKIIIIREITNQ